MNPSGRSTFHPPGGNALSSSTSASTSRRVVWKGGIIVRDRDDDSKTLQGIVFQAPTPLPLHLSFYPPTPSASSLPSEQNTPSVPLEMACSTPSSVATSSKVTLDTPFGGATQVEDSRDEVIDGLLQCKSVKHFFLGQGTVELKNLTSSLRSNDHDLAYGVRVIASQSSTEAIRHIQTLLIPPKMKQPQALDSSGRTLRGIILSSTPSAQLPLSSTPPLLLYGIKHTSPKDNKPRLLLFITLYKPDPTPPVSRLSRIDLMLQQRADRAASIAPAALAPPPPIATPVVKQPAILLSRRRTRDEEEEEERDPLPEPRRRFKDKLGMGRGALLHHLPSPRPPPKRKVVPESNGRGKQRQERPVDADVGALKKRRVEAEGGQNEVIAQRVEAREPVVVEKEEVPSLEQVNRNNLRSQVSLALTSRGVWSDHPEFKSLGQWITRGAGFSLRDIFTTKLIDVDDMSEAIGSHLESYLPKELKTLRSIPRTVEMVEAGSQTHRKILVEMCTQKTEPEVVVEMEEAAVAEEEGSPLEAEGAKAAVAPEVVKEVEEKPPARPDAIMENLVVAVKHQEEAVSLIIEQEEEDATVTLTSKLFAPLVPLPPVPVRCSARNRNRTSNSTSPLTSIPSTSTEVFSVSSATISPAPTPPPVELATTPTQASLAAESAVEESITPTKTRSGRMRVLSNRGKKDVESSPLKRSQVAKVVEAMESPAIEVEVNVVAVMEDEQVEEVEEGEVAEGGEDLVAEPVVEEQQEKSSAPISAVELPSPTLLPDLAHNWTSSRRTSLVVAPAEVSPPVFEDVSGPILSEPALPPPSPLIYSSSSQTPTKLPFHRTRSNRSALSSHHESSPITPQAPAFVADVEVVTPTASTSTSNKRTRAGAKKLQSGPEPDLPLPSSRASRSRRGSVMPVAEEVKVVKQGQGKKIAVDPVVAEAIAPAAMEIVAGEAEPAVVPKALAPLELELEEGEILEDEEMQQEKEVVVPTDAVVKVPVLVTEEEMEVEAVAAPVPPPSPSRLALAQSTSHVNLALPFLSNEVGPSSPHLLKILNNENGIPAPPTETLSPTVSTSALSHSLSKLLNLHPSPSYKLTTLAPPFHLEIPTPPAPAPITIHHPSPIRTTPHAVFALLEETAESVLLNITSKPSLTSLSKDQALPPLAVPHVRRASFKVLSLLNPSPPQPTSAAFAPPAAIGISGGAGKKKKSLPPLPSAYDEGVDAKWKAGLLAKEAKKASATPVVSAATAAPAVAKLPFFPTKPTIGLPLATPPPPTISRRPATPVPKPIALASLLAAYSSSPAQPEQHDEEHEPMLGLFGVPASSPLRAGAGGEKEKSSAMPILAVEEFFVAEPEEETAKEPLTERDPEMYYTDEDSDMRDDGQGARIVKKGWF